MIIKYKCKCMKNEREIAVTDRVPGTDIGAWMEGIIRPCVSYDHNMRQALCVVPTMEYVKIPHEGDGEVGVPVAKG